MPNSPTPSPIIPPLPSEYDGLNAWQLAIELSPYTNTAELCIAIDPFLSRALTNKDDLSQIFYYLNRDEYISLMPLTQAKIELIINGCMVSDGWTWQNIQTYKRWLSKSLIKTIIEGWVNDTDTQDYPYYLKDTLEEFAAEADLGVKILSRLTAIYKVNKIGYTMTTIEKVFVKIPVAHIDQACDILAASTPAVQVILFKRSDVPEKYYPKALKALGKLSTQREISAKLDFSALERLGPKERLNTMRQLLGTYDHYYKMMNYYKSNSSHYSESYSNYYKTNYDTYGKQKTFPFKEIPSKEEVEKFLFPCALKYNKEVNEIMTRYNELIEQLAKQGANKIV